MTISIMKQVYQARSVKPETLYLIEQVNAVTEYVDLDEMEAVKAQQESERQQLHTLARQV